MRHVLVRLFTCRAIVSQYTSVNAIIVAQDAPKSHRLPMLRWIPIKKETGQVGGRKRSTWLTPRATASS